MFNVTITLKNQHASDVFADVTVCTPYNENVGFVNVAASINYTVHPSVVTQIMELLHEGCVAQAPVSKHSLIENNHLQPNILTVKEKQVLQLLAKGYSYKMIASELQKSIETIRVQLKKIYKKLQVNSNTGAVLKFQGLGM